MESHTHHQGLTWNLNMKNIFNLLFDGFIFSSQVKLRILHVCEIHCLEMAGSLLTIGSMYGIFTHIYHKNQPNVGKYTIHGSYGLYL